MVGRASPEDAAERIAWELNFHKGDEVSLNELADLTDLSWATIKKYTQLIETLQKVAPEIAISSEGVRSGGRAAILEEILSEPERALSVYLLIHAEVNGGATAEVDAEILREAIEDADVLTKMEKLGWIKQSSGDVQLTPLGVKIAGKTRSEVLSGTREITHGSHPGWQTEYTNAEASAAKERRYELNDPAGEANDEGEFNDESENMFSSAPAI